MLNSTIDFSNTLIPPGATWDAASVTVVPERPVNAMNLPDEPSTLALALVGIGIVGAYAGLGRRRRREQPAAKVLTVSVSERQHVAERPKRGAA